MNAHTEAFNKIDYTKTPHPSGVLALSLKDAPALIELLIPAQKISVDSYKEQKSLRSKFLAPMASYWKGRKPLVLNRACVLASLLPATNNPLKDLEVFEMLMGMDDISLSKRLGLASIREIISTLEIDDIWKYFKVSPAEHKQNLPAGAPLNLNDYPYYDKKGIAKVPTLAWRDDVSDDAKHDLASRLFESKTYRDLASEAKRAEEIADQVYTHIWPHVNAHLGSNAKSFPELVEQLGVMRFGHRPTVADNFSGSGQIPFAAAQLGCDVYASDLNPVACMLTWGAFNIVGALPEKRLKIEAEQKDLVEKVKAEIDALGFESDGNGWRGKSYLYCIEVVCPSSGWKVPVLPTRIVSRGKGVIAILIPNEKDKKYDIKLKFNCSAKELVEADKNTTLARDSKFGGAIIVHTVNGVEHRNPFSAIKGTDSKNTNFGFLVGENIRLWEKEDFIYDDNDFISERLYAIQWIKPCSKGRSVTEFREVTNDDIKREIRVIEFVRKNLKNWQISGIIPDTRIEPGGPPRYEGKALITSRGWTHWHHLFNPRQLLIAALFAQHKSSLSAIGVAQLCNWNSRLSHWNHAMSAVAQVFYNQALNPFMSFGCRGVVDCEDRFKPSLRSSPIQSTYVVENKDSILCSQYANIFITDPPYGNAVKYEEIYEFFIAWLRKNPPAEFAHWIWDSRRELAIKGEDHDFKLSMVKAYKRMAEYMPDNGLQIIMFTHQDGNIWADMANIVWASGLQVTAAWYLVTETDSALRDGSYVKGTILLVLRKRVKNPSTTQMELAYEIEEEVANQVHRLTGLNDEVSQTKRAKDGNLFEDADLQMAGYAAALKVLTQYSNIDGKDMTQEALRQRVKGQKLLVDELIDFAVNSANKQLVPIGITESIWHDLNPSERFYLKMVDLESKGLTSLDNYQNFAKAFSVKDWQCMMASEKANKARVKNSKELAKTEIGQGAELTNTVTRAVLYALMELRAEKDVEDVVKTMTHNLPNYYTERETVIHLAQYLAKKRVGMDDEEASAARILAGYVEHQGI